MIKLFVGCSANGEDAEAQALLEYTLRKHHPTNDIELTWMMLSKDVSSPWYSNPARQEGWNTKGWATPFSAFRWAIPHVCNFEGRAIYTDVDKVFMADIFDLWNQQIPPGKCLLMKDDKHSCVILYDCAAAKKYIPAFETLRRTEGMYRNVRRTIGGAAANFTGNWNCLDGENYPTLPSIWSCTRRFSSMAYSIGSSFTSGSIKPATTRPSAWSLGMPRLIK